MRNIFLFMVFCIANFPANAKEIKDVIGDGRVIYQRYCLSCHGPAGEGMMPGMPNFARGDRLIRTDRELIDAVKDGNGVMPSFYGILEEEDIENVVAFLRTLL
ncbi:MAG: cytochrome c [Gammaproteobacteria bacterium]|nr:cytochrome c [Gammaproteobacteria bacterium]